ncbi:hypothetical protein [Hymenobacter cavernae]|uniref:Uncharacterized protein n=1 Tax=Hymenobacter cavernae TaxID=2044852 RepID=A0ABQ1TGI9_9BACT|nr:hypothetical protein [Hymenobacter cavernae]GGE94030.1 hypothetical protein GCM10011383_00910 [Hymenobacter cavernae]
MTVTELKYGPKVAEPSPASAPITDVARPESRFGRSARFRQVVVQETSAILAWHDLSLFLRSSFVQQVQEE